MQKSPLKRGKAYRKRRRVSRAGWVKIVAAGIAALLCAAAIWLIWLRPEAGEPQAMATPTPTQALGLPSASPTPVLTPTPSSTPTPVPTPTPLPEATACAPGDTGEAVKMMQTMLIELGFDPGSADGVYGEQLESAVSNFQIYAGLSVDGIAGTQTAAALTERWQAVQQMLPADEQPLKGFVIGLDAGHQRDGNADKEPVSPGSSVMKPKVSTGTQGQFTGVPEYVVNLQVALKLKAALEALGAEVVMTRETHGVDIPNSERAQMMNEAHVDCWLRIHANYNGNPDNKGMFILVPAEGCLDTGDVSVTTRSVALAQALLDSAVAATGAENDGLVERDDQTGFNWSQVPVCNIEMGYMSNEQEDRLLVTEDYQEKIVKGLTEGFVDYFSGIQ